MPAPSVATATCRLKRLGCYYCIAIALSVKQANMIAASAKPIQRVVCTSSMWTAERANPG